MKILWLEQSPCWHGNLSRLNFVTYSFWALSKSLHDQQVYIHRIHLPDSLSSDIKRMQYYWIVEKSIFKIININHFQQLKTCSLLPQSPILFAIYLKSHLYKDHTFPTIGQCYRTFWMMDIISNFQGQPISVATWNRDSRRQIGVCVKSFRVLGHSNRNTHSDN